MPKQDVTVELYYDGAWHDITAEDDVFTSTPIRIQRGQGEESTALRPSKITMQLANDDDRYRTSNPESPLYGKVGRNTPLRVSVGGTVRGIGEVGSWSTGQSRDFRRNPKRGKAWTDIEAAGILQRISQWGRKVQSPISRFLQSMSSPIGLWPLEDAGINDGTGGGSFAQMITPDWANSLGSPTGTGVTYQGDAGPAGGDKCAVFKLDGAASGATGRFSTYLAGSVPGWQVLMHFKLIDVTLTATFQTLFSIATLGGTFYWEINDTNFRIRFVDSTGASLLSSSVARVIDPTQWFRCRLKATISAGTVTAEYAWYEQDAAAVYGSSGTFAASELDAPRTWVIYATTDGQLAATAVFGTLDTATSLTNGDAASSFNGFRLEKTAGRWFRLLSTENGLAYTYIGNFGEASLMGAQRPDSLPNLLKEIGATEDGLIYDDIAVLRPALLLRNARYNQTPALELTPDDLPFLPDEITDDLNVSNVVTVSQRDGAEATARDDTSSLGTQDPPDGVGEYRQTVDVNIAYQSDLPRYANWWLYRGTVDLPRFPQVTINLGAKPELVSAVEAVKIGSVITITGMREYVIRLIVLGYTETIGTHSRVITFNCVPDQQFQTGEYDDGTTRYDSRSTTLGTSITSSDTAMEFSTTNPGDLWTITEAPFDVLCEGQRNTVVWMSHAGSVVTTEGGFETGTSGWNLTGVTLVQSSAQARTGTNSALITVTGSPSTAAVSNTTLWPVVTGDSYTAYVWVYSPSGTVNNVRINIGWFTSVGGSISTTSGSTTSISAGAWTLLTATGTAPATATQARWLLSISSSPANGTQLHVDDADLASNTAVAGAGPYVQKAWVTRSPDVTKALAAGSPIHVADQGRYAL